MEHARPPPELRLDGNSVSRADEWKRWKTQFKLFLKASGVHKEEGGVQASLLINLIGSEGFDVFETFTFQSETEKDDVALLLKKFDEHFGVKPNVTLARYNFFIRNQESGESIDQYVTALKILSKVCQFGSLEEELIRDRIVCGIRNTVVRDRLLRTDDLTLEKALKIGQVDEISNDSSRVLETSRAGSGPAHVDTLRARRGTGINNGPRGGVQRSWRGGGHRRALPPPWKSSEGPMKASSSFGICPRCGGFCHGEENDTLEAQEESMSYLAKEVEDNSRYKTLEANATVLKLLVNDKNGVSKSEVFDMLHSRDDNERHIDLPSFPEDEEYIRAEIPIAPDSQAEFLQATGELVRKDSQRTRYGRGEPYAAAAGIMVAITCSIVIIAYTSLIVWRRIYLKRNGLKHELLRNEETMAETRIEM